MSIYDQVSLILVGNKFDLADANSKKYVSQEEAEGFGKRIGAVGSFQGSSFEPRNNGNRNIDKAFILAMKTFLANQVEEKKCSCCALI